MSEELKKKYQEAMSVKSGRRSTKPIRVGVSGATVTVLLSNRDSVRVEAEPSGSGYAVTAKRFSDLIYSRTLSASSPEEALASAAAGVGSAYRGLLKEEMGTLETAEGEKLDPEDWVIDKIVDIRVEGEEVITKVDEAGAAQPLNTDMSAKDVKRGDVLWITALLKPKSGSPAYAPNQLGVLKVRVVDLYYNLSAMKYAK